MSAAIAEPEIVEEPATGAPPIDDPMHPDNLSRYDAETVRRVTEQNELVREAGATYAAAHERAKDLKKDWEVELIRLHDLIRQRKEFRGKKPERPDPTLLDSLPWRELPLADLDLPEEIETPVWDKVETVGELVDALAAGQTFELAEADLATVRQAVEEFKAKHDTKPEADPLAELWREFPVAGWTEFGLTAGDVAKLHEGECKKGGERFPIRTVGDLNRFVSPSPAMPDFTRTYADLKGFGEAAATRLSDAEEKFWKAWNEGGLKEAFAAERGLTDGTQAQPADSSEVLGHGDEANGKPTSNGKPKRKKK